MTIENVQTNETVTQNVNNTANSQTQQNNSIDISNLSNPFTVAETLNNLDSTATQVSNEQESTSKQELQTDNKPDNKEIPPNEEQINKLIEADPILQRYETLINSGLTKEEAEKKVYEDEYNTLPTLESVNADSFYSPETQQFLNISDEQLSALKNAYKNPPESALLFHLNNSPEYKSLVGDEFEKIESLDQYTDPLTNFLFKKVLIDDYRRVTGEIISNIENAREQRNTVISQQNKLEQELSDIYHKTFPELKEENNFSEKMAVHFVYDMQQKLMKLSQKDRLDPEMVKKVFNSSMEDFKKKYPVFKKRFGQEQKNSVNADLANLKLQQMQTVTTSPTNNIDNVNFTLSTNNNNDTEVANILANLDKLKQ